MESFIGIYESVVAQLGSFLYTYFLVFLLIACGIYFTIRTRFIQIRFLPDALKILKERGEKEHISPFNALMISTASRVGIGNIVGVAVAISSGGIGALFWMWIVAIVGGASAFVESTLAQVYKRKEDSHNYKGGPAYYIESALGSRTFGLIFAIALILCFSYGFNALQAYTLTSAFEVYVGDSFYESGVTIFIGIILAVLVAGFYFGKSKVSAIVSSILVPIMAIGYLLVALVVVATNFHQIPMIFGNVIAEAFDFQAIFGGFAGSAFVIGIKRGLFSNEAGMGSAPNAAAAAHTSHPAKQGMVQTLSVFIDTLVVCSASAFIVLCSTEDTQGLKGLPLVQKVMEGYFGDLGLHFISIVVVLFAFTSLIGNHFYAEANFKFITHNKTALQIFRASAVFCVFLGAQMSLGLAWDSADVVMGIMATINIVAILLLGNIAIKVLDDYNKQKKEGKNPVFKAKNIGIHNTECWK